MTSVAANALAYGFLPLDIDGVAALAELALDLRWSWNHAADAIWRALDPALWRLTHNPWVLLQTASRDQLQELLANTERRAAIAELVRRRRDLAQAPSWFQRNHDAKTCGIAYLSMEFMLSEALPIYSGGLGNVAGDQLKAASDLGVPVTAVGLLYQQGYFRQVIDQFGAQQAFFPYNDPGQLPITPLREAGGEWLRIELAFPGGSLWLRTWQAQVGRARLLLLDSNDPANMPAYRGITSELYGGGDELRLQQELVLGIGGWRLLHTLGCAPEVCHLNEGHAAFAVLERARQFMLSESVPFATALSVTRAGNLFTTHTSVTAAFDRFAPSLIEQYLGEYASNELKIEVSELLSLGRAPHAGSGEAGEPFNMAFLAAHGSGAINAVSQLHSEVSRQIFAPLFPRRPLEELPIGYVTNGVHMPSWDSVAADRLWTHVCGKDRWLDTTEEHEDRIRQVSDADLWEMRGVARLALIKFARERWAQQQRAAGRSGGAISAEDAFDPDALTLGFARRFAAYKRPTLLLHDRERLKRLLTNSAQPVQLIIAGKAHPADRVGQQMIREWTSFLRDFGVGHRAVFLSDYDILLTEHLVQGVDVWLNTPRRPWEACGTSGMKVLVNGGLNVSELDGWWAEAYRPEVGWALGDGREHDADPVWDAQEAAQLYELLEQQIVPEFYRRDVRGVPLEWVARIRESMASLTPRFSANRAVREYTERFYLPAAKNFRERSAENATVGRQIAAWRQQIERHWAALRFGSLNSESAGEGQRVTVQVYLDDLDPEYVAVELYADGRTGNSAEVLAMRREQALVGASGGYIYAATIPPPRSAEDFTARIVPHCGHACVPLESARILWQR